MAVSRSVKKLFEGNSPVNKYDLLTLEQQGVGLTEERMVLAFQALDELIPNLGVFSRIFQKLREDLFEAVYSDELTGSAESQGVGDSGYIQRLPYFSLVRQVYNERHEFTEELKEQLEIVKKRLFDKHKQLEEAQETIADKEDHISVLNSTKDELQSIIEDKDKQIEELEEELEQTRDQARNKEHQLECDIADLKESLDEAKTEINYLSQFKKGYDDLYYAFMEKNDALDCNPKKKKKSMISTKRANLLSGAESAQKLEEQVLSVMNTAIEEYDKYIETHKTDLVEKVYHEDMTEAELDLQDLEMNEADEELESVQKRFQGTIGNLMTELELLRQHSTMLMEQLQILEEIKPAAPRKKETKAANGKGDSLLFAGLEEEEITEEVADPFIPQERVFSKYAAMLYTSNNHGKTFEEFKDAKYCASCGEKTVICPHKLGGAEKIFILPHNCSHIKIIRPKVRINKEFAEDIMKPQSPDPTLDFAPSMSSAGHSFVSGQIQDMPATPGTVTSRESPSLGAGEVYMVHTMQRLWDDYRQRTSIERTIPRALDPERSKSLLEQFLGYVVWTDEYTTDEEANLSILDTLYCFMHDRYLVEDVMYMATHDFLSAITEYSGIDKMLQLLGHVLVGNLDASCLRYVLLMCDFISAVDWREVEDFRAFTSVVYPFLNEDDLESLQMSYTSYSENRISRQRVSSFIIHIILKYREPRFHDLENRLVAFQTSEGGQLNEREFKEALDSLLPLSNERTRRRLYMQAERAVRWDGIIAAVPIMRLAQISGYLALQQITNLVKENVAVRVAEWRDRPSSAGSVPRQGDVTHEIISFDKLLSLSDVKLMAANMNRQAKNREERKTTSSQDDDEEDW
ncbi:uncharacterized protein LOC101853915 [Aplysia californica]|uniref:Uncharacterized protein LOC101853915 n=1 Tax=Aplysia californica TaxID=6500 RepID=A0ABM0ZUD4_APLCA|nr:uncharacterized protein LOC101853915 [Aplysia californica]